MYITKDIVGEHRQIYSHHVPAEIHGSIIDGVLDGLIKFNSWKDAADCAAYPTDGVDLDLTLVVNVSQLLTAQCQAAIADETSRLYGGTLSE